MGDQKKKKKTCGLLSLTESENVQKKEREKNIIFIIYTLSFSKDNGENK